MSKYYHLKVKEIIRETPDTVSIHFWHPWNEVIQYKPGQYLTILWPTPDGSSIRRSYSLSSSPFTDVSPAITVKRIYSGIVSNELISNTKADDILEVMQPLGTFCLDPNPDLARTVFLFCTGSGITPLLSITKSVLIAEPDSKIVLFYGNRSEEDIIFRDTLLALKNKYGDRLTVVYALTQPSGDWQGARGRLTPEKLRELLLPYAAGLSQPDSLFFLCGQNDFMEETRGLLLSIGANPDAIRSESFYIDQQLSQTVDKNDDSADRSESRQITLQYEGQTHELAVAPHQTVLEAALENDIDLPYSCQAGMCTACLGRVLKGTVRLDEYDALTAAEVAEGFILTCVAHPTSDDVVIEVE
ncbi:ferredoxin--NADP reductase [Ravibacter arvi]